MPKEDDGRCRIRGADVLGNLDAAGQRIVERNRNADDLGCLIRRELCRKPAAAIIAPTSMAMTVGQKLGSYQILGLIGSGGQGEVYRAHDSTLKRDVAIKVLPEGPAAESEHRSEEHTSELQSLTNLVCRLLLEKKKSLDCY